jgi:5-deoxy-5-amino-3-dehydroquinate synthase
MSTTVTVELGSRNYPIVVGSDAIEALAASLSGGRRVAVVSQHPVLEAHGARLMRALEAQQLVYEVFEMADGEDAKTLSTVDELCRRFATWGLLRDDVVVAYGGGVVGDTAGFAAAVYHRGVDVVQVPTTLLAMVDSAIGGKTGVNLPQGKNLVGAFHQPRGVYADPSVLASLPDREYRCGLGEVAKYALMDASLRPLDVRALNARDIDVLSDVVTGCATIKARYVVADELERTGVRAALNYGHTLAHALETTTGHSLMHGEAVAIGLVFAAELAGALERIDPNAVTNHYEMLEALHLPTEAPAGLRAADLLSTMARDKKARGGLTFMLPGPNGIERVDDPDRSAIDKAFAAIGVVD